jgi:hypothetical protein
MNHIYNIEDSWGEVIQFPISLVEFGVMRVVVSLIFIDGLGIPHWFQACTGHLMTPYISRSEM